MRCDCGSRGCSRCAFPGCRAAPPFLSKTLPKPLEVSTSREGFFTRGRTAMLDAAVKAISQILSPPMRTILWRSIGLALVVITVLAIGLQRLLSWFAVSGEAWAEALL